MKPAPKLHRSATVILLCHLLVGACALTAKTPDVLLPPRFSDPKFSPDGQYIAVGARDEAGHRYVVMTDMQSMKPVTVFATEPGRERGVEVKNVTSFNWVTGHLVVTSDVKAGANSLHTVEAGKRYLSSGRRDGKYTFITAEPGSSSFLVAVRPLDDKPGVCRVLKLDAADTAAEEEVFSVESGTFDCVADHLGRLRLVKHDETVGGTPAWFARDPDTGAWTKTSIPSWFRVVAFEYKPDLVLVAGYHQSANPGLHYYSLTEDKVVHTLLVNDRFAMDQVATPLYADSTQTMVGVHLDLDVPITKWIDPTFKRFADSINASLKDSRNRIVAWSPDLRFLVIERIFGDAPTELTIVDNQKSTLTPLGTNGGKVDRASMGSYESITFDDRAGVKIGGYLTAPRKPSPKGHPLVVLLGADPWFSKANFGWNNQAQYLASQGFAVLRLNFRGSGKLTGASHIDWKTLDDVRKPFEDIADAIDYLAREKGIDGTRVGIVGFGGASGWMATYAPIALPGRFRAAAALAGIFDLVDYRETADRSEPLRDMGTIPFAEPGSALSLEDLRTLSPMHNLSASICPLFIDYGRWSPGRFSDASYAFMRDARKAGIDLEKPLAADFYGAQLDNEKTLADYFDRLGAFFKRTL